MNDIKYPAPARKSGTQGDVYVSFKIDSLGKLKDVNILHDVANGCGKEVLRVLTKMPPNFIKEGDDALYILPVKFRLGDTALEQGNPLQLPDGKMLSEIVVRGYISDIRIR